MNRDAPERQLEFDKPNFYSNKVLVGRWFEEQKTYKKNNYKHQSEYTTKYTPKPLSKGLDNELWNLKLKDERNDVFPPDPEGLDNNHFTTVYDLSYQHFPKIVPGPIIRKGRLGERKKPTDEYAGYYGNLTKFGLMDAFKKKWECDLQTDTQASVYKAEYEPPSSQSYETKRFATPTPNSSALYKVNIKNRSSQFRGTKIYFVPPTEGMVQKVQEKHYNPITWTL